MKGLLFGILAVIFCKCVTGCNTMRYKNDISKISHTSDSGTILPELQWHEEIIITKDSVSLTRNGKATDTEINEGIWEFPVDEQKVTALFEKLKAVNCATIKRIEPDSPIDGGDTESYTIVYAGNKTCSLVYDPGTTYANGELIVKPVEAFIQSLSLLVDSGNRYK